MMKNFIPNECIFYHIYPLGFCGAPLKNTGEKTENRIAKIGEWIPHMKKLGVNALYLGPVFDSGFHGYDTHDYRMLDRRLGTNQDFKELCHALNQAGIHVILDGVFNHVGRGFFAFEDVLKNRENSKYCSWISGLRFDGNNSYGDNLYYDNWGGHEMLVKLNLKNPQVREYLLDSVKMWIDEFGIDGLRLDAADCIDHDFFRELRRVTSQIKPDFWLMGEIIHGDYRIWVNDSMLHSVTNYECHKGLHSSVSSKNMFEIMHSLEREFGPWGLYKDCCLYNFVDNHDVNRLASILKHFKQNLKNIYTILFTMPGAPSIYYGSEWAIEGEKVSGSDQPLRPAIDVKNPNIIDFQLMEHIIKLSQIRKASPALKYGNFERVAVQSEWMIFSRSYNEEKALVFVNISSEEKTLTADCFGRRFEERLPAYSSKILSI